MKRYWQLIAFMILFVLCILFMVNSAHAASSAGRKTQREFLLADNTTTYLMGMLEGGKIFEYHGEEVTNVMVQPYRTSQIFERSLTFCGDQGDKFRGKSGLIVITYDRVMHRSFCYDLLDIHVAYDK